jgi:hypothetical protein
MVTVNDYGYLVRRSTKGKEKSFSTCNWWLGKKSLNLGSVSIPERYHGKRLCLKIEIIEDEINE